jgi:hypothetical protein
MNDLDVIVGLYDIIDKFSDLFLQFIQKAVETHNKNTGLHALEAGEASPCESELAPGAVIQWSNGDDDGAPENEECPDPCSFTGPLYYMETGHQEALDLYYSQFETHVEPDFLNHPGVKELLKSELATNRFVPKEWTGLKGFPPLKLRFKETLPDSHPVRARPVNPRLFCARRSVPG